MARIDMIRSCQQAIRQTSDELLDAILYLDAGTAEAFQYVGGFVILAEMGPRAVCSLEQSSPLDMVVNWQGTPTEAAKKMVFMTSRLLSDTHRYILRCLNMHRSVNECIIFSSVSEVLFGTATHFFSYLLNAHSLHIDAPLGPDAYQEYEALLLQDYQELLLKDALSQKSKVLEETEYQTTKNQDESSFRPDVRYENTEYGSVSVEKNLVNMKVSVRHFPVVLCPIAPSVFVLPSECAVAQARLSDKIENSLSPGLPPFSKLFSDGEDIPGATLTADFLHYLANQMDLKLEIFSLGPLSHVIGNMLTNLSSLYDVGGRSKRSTGLLLIDRSLDIITPCCHGDSPLDRMFSVLHRREGESLVQNPLDSNSMIKVNNSLQRPTLDFRVSLESILNSESLEDKASNFLDQDVNAFLSKFKGHFDIGCENTDEKKIKDSILEKKGSKLDLFYGSLGSTGYFKGGHCLEALLQRHMKDGITLIRKWLQEALRQEKVTFSNRIGAVTAPVLHSLLLAFSSKRELIMKYAGIIQLGKAAEDILSEPFSTHWEAFASAEKILMLTAGDTSQSLSQQLKDHISQSVNLRTQNQGKRSCTGIFSCKDALILLIIGYSLGGEYFGGSQSTGPFSWEEENELKRELLNAVLECDPGGDVSFLHGLEISLESHWQKKQTSSVTDTKQETSIDEQIESIDFEDEWGNWDDEEETENEAEYQEYQLKLELQDRLDSIFKVLHKVSSARKNLTIKDKLTTIEEMSGSTPINRGLIAKVLSMVYAKCDIPGLEYHSSTVGRLLKSGFSRFGLGQAKPKLEEQNLLFVFVVGGINAAEVSEAQQVQLNAGSHRELLIGGTTILTPDIMFDLLLGSSSFFKRSV